MAFKDLLLWKQKFISFHCTLKQMEVRNCSGYRDMKYIQRIMCIIHFLLLLWFVWDLVWRVKYVFSHIKNYTVTRISDVKKYKIKKIKLSWSIQSNLMRVNFCLYDHCVVSTPLTMLNMNRETLESQLSRHQSRVLLHVIETYLWFTRLLFIYSISI